MTSINGNSLRHFCSSAEAELLLHCARVQLEPRRVERVRALAHGNLNWELLLGLAQRNGLSPLLFFHLNRTCADLAPPGPLSELRNYFRANNAFNLLLTGELVSLLKL